MAIVHLEIWKQTPERYELCFEAPFNPKGLTFNKTTKWSAAPTKDRDVPQQQFTHGEGMNLTVELLLDSYEKGGSIKKDIDTLRALTVVDARLGDHPPYCRLFWGKFGGAEGKIFAGILETLTENYTLFLPDGTPVRATVTCSFSELREKNQDPPQAQQTDQAKTHVVKKGDSLPSIALAQYGDASQWRRIAEANGIDDPLDPSLAGSVLSILPKGGRGA